MSGDVVLLPTRKIVPLMFPAFPERRVLVVRTIHFSVYM
jgi:hypothetical protein